MSRGDSYNLGNDLLQLPDSLEVDSRLLIGEHKRVLIRRGASNFTVNRQTSSSLSNGQIVFNVILNSPQSTIIDPLMYVELSGTATVSAAGLPSGQLIDYLKDNFALRQYPLASICNTTTVTLNNQSVSSRPADWIHALSWFQPLQDKSITQSKTPIYPDKAQSYNQMAASLLSPLNSYFSGGEHYSDPRGVFNALWTTTTSNATTYTFNFTIREPIMNPLLDYDPSKSPREGLAFVNNLNIQMMFTSNLSRIFSLDAVACPLVTGTVVNFTSANLVMNWLTIPTNQRVPQRTLRSFNTIVSQATIGTAVTQGASTTLVSQSYSFNQVPRRLWIYACDSTLDSSTGYTLPDAFFSIQNINILFNNRQSLLGNMSASDLYDNCQADSGCRISFVESQKYVGSVLELDCVKLLGLQDDQTSGVLGNFNFSVTVQCTNPSTRTITPNLWVVQSNESILQTTDASISNVIQGYITPQDVLTATGLPARPTMFEEHDIYGGGFLDFLSNIGSKLFNFAKDSGIVGKTLGLIPHPLGQIGSTVAKSLGFGNGGYEDMPRGGRRATRRQAEQRYESLVH